MEKKTFKTAERLKSKKEIDFLFKKGKGIVSAPIRLVYIKLDSQMECSKVMFTVSKKNFKRAVDRNRIKRQMREAYRLNKGKLLEQVNDQHFLLAFIFTSNAIIPYELLEKKLNLALERLTKI